MDFRRLLPKTPSDRMACGFFCSMIPVIFCFEVFVVLPTVYHEERTFGYNVHIFAALVCLVNVLGSLQKLLVTNSTIKGIMLPSTLKPGWRFCSCCECNSPPRSFHCRSCDICVLKRDHHCVFTGNCIGYQNHRYYLSLIVWLCISGIYANIMNLDYTWEVLGGFNIKTLATMIFPLFAWLLGLSQAHTFFVSFISAAVIIGTLLSFAFLAYQANLIFNGQTTYENSHRIKDYNLNWKENVKLVFGKNWCIAWISPFVSSPLNGNGTEFVKKSTWEDVKDM